MIDFSIKPIAHFEEQNKASYNYKAMEEPIWDHLDTENLAIMESADLEMDNREQTAESAEAVIDQAESHL